MATSDFSEPKSDTDLLDEVARAIASLETHTDPAVREAVRTLLEGIDAVHRAGLSHLVQGLQGMAGDAFLNRLVGDPAIRLLLMSYNLVAVDRRLQAEEALDTVRGHLHDHGIDVEIVEVVGGVVYVRLHASHRAGGQPDLQLDAVRRDLEAALHADFVGFQELVVRDRDANGASSQFVPIEGLRNAKRPVYEDVLACADLAPGTMRAVRVKEIAVLLANVEGEIYGIRNQCAESPLPLEFGTLQGNVVRCPWHRCRYDVRSGRRLDDDSYRLQTFPVSIDEGRIRIAVGVESDGGGH